MMRGVRFLRIALWGLGFQLLAGVGFSNEGLPRSTPEAEGVASSAILEFIETIEEKGLGLHSYMIARNGKVISEGWWAPYGRELPHVMFSVSKSFTSTAIGMAIEEGKLSLDDTVVSFFPEDLPSEVSGRLNNMRIRDLLTMNTGHQNDTLGRLLEAVDMNWVAAFLSFPVENKPGTRFVYNNGATYMLSAVLQKVTGETVFDYLTPRLFEPLGIENISWWEDSEGINFGAFGLNLKTEDLLKFGQLYLQEGEWDGEQVVSKEWVREATRLQTRSGSAPTSDWDQGYGYQFWMNTWEGSYRADGAFGQYCMVFPEEKMVVAITSGVSNGDLWRVMSEVWEVLMPGVKGEALIANEGAVAALEKKSVSLKRPIVEGKAKSKREESFGGVSYRFEENELGLKSVGFSFEGERVVMSVEESAAAYDLELGLKNWATSDTAFLRRSITEWMESFEVAAKAAWEDEDTLAVQLIYVETPFEANVRFHFGKDEVRMEGAFEISFADPHLPELVGKRGNGE